MCREGSAQITTPYGIGGTRAQQPPQRQRNSCSGKQLCLRSASSCNMPLAMRQACREHGCTCAASAHARRRASRRAWRPGRRQRDHSARQQFTRSTGHAALALAHACIAATKPKLRGHARARCEHMWWCARTCGAHRRRSPPRRAQRNSARPRRTSPSAPPLGDVPLFSRFFGFFLVTAFGTPWRPDYGTYI